MRLPNDHVATLEIVHHPGGAAVVALDDDESPLPGKAVSARRPAAGSGKSPPARSTTKSRRCKPRSASSKKKPAGKRAQWRSLGDYLSSPGFLTEVVHLFLATGLKVVESQLEAGEVLEAHWLPFEHVMQMAQSGELRDGKSLAALLRVAAYVQTK